MRVIPTLVAGLVGLVIAMPMTQTAWASSASGYAAAESVPPRPAREDIAPIQRQGRVDQLATIRQRGSLRACVVPVAPMAQRDAQGQWTGLSIELAQQLAQDIGVSLDITPTNWVDVVADLLHQQCDAIITGLWRTTQRALVVNFTQPTVTEGVYLVGRRHAAHARPYPQGYNQPAVRIGIVDDPLQRQVLRERFPRAQAVVIEGTTLPSALADGQVDAALFTTLAPEALLLADPQRLRLPSRQPLAQTSAAIAIRKGDADFLNLLDTWLAIQRESGWLNERAMHWSRPAP